MKICERDGKWMIEDEDTDKERWNMKMEIDAVVGL